MTKAFIKTTTGDLKVQSTLKHGESVQHGQAVNKLQTLFQHPSHKTGQEAEFRIQDPQRHLSFKPCRLRSSNLPLRTPNPDVLISKANEKRWNVGGPVEPYRRRERKPGPTSGLLSPHLHVPHHGKSAPIIISSLIAYVLLIFHSVIKKRDGYHFIARFIAGD